MDPEKIGGGKQTQLARIKEEYKIDFMVFLDDQETNIDPKKQWQYLVPSEQAKNTPPQTRKLFLANDQAYEEKNITERDLQYIFAPDDVEISDEF